MRVYSRVLKIKASMSSAPTRTGQSKQLGIPNAYVDKWRDCSSHILFREQSDMNVSLGCHTDYFCVVAFFAIVLYILQSASFIVRSRLRCRMRLIHVHKRHV